MHEPKSEIGRILLNEFITPLFLTPEELAEDLGWPMNKMQNILDGEEDISELIAIEFSKYFGNSVDFWLSLESSDSQE